MKPIENIEALKMMVKKAQAGKRLVILCYRCAHELEPRVTDDDGRNVFWCPECCEEKVFRSPGDPASSFSR